MKKIISMFGLLLLAMTIQIAYASFPDVSKNHTYYNAIDYVQEQGIVSGYEDGTFKPDDKINRAEFTKIIIGAIYTSEEIDNCKFEKKFPDVPENEWYAKYIYVARNEGIINGYPDGTFKPGNEINFAEASKIVVNTYGLEPVGTADGEEHWYLPFVDALYLQAAVPLTITDYGVSITRGEMAEVIFGVETEQGYTGDNPGGIILDPDDTWDDTADDVTDDTVSDDTADDVADDTVSDDTGEGYTAAEIRSFINDCSKVMIQQDELPAGYTIDHFEVYRGGGANNDFADCFQYINRPGMTSDEYPTTIRYLIAESEEVTHEQMDIIAADMPEWDWETDECPMYIGGKLSYYIEGEGYFINGGINDAEDEMNNILYDRAWNLTEYYGANYEAHNGANCIGVRENNPQFDDQNSDTCQWIAEDIALGEFQGWVFMDNNGVLREDQCYFEISEDFVKDRLETYYGSDYMDAWNFFNDDYERTKLIFSTYEDSGNFYRSDFVGGVIDESVYIK